MRTSRADLTERLHLAWSRVRRLPLQLLLVPPAAVLLYVMMQVPFTPSPAELRKAKAEQASAMVAADGTVLAEFKRLNREWRTLDRISVHMVRALIATEDHRFLEHGGIDWRRTAAAAWYTLRGDRQGGSTLTQQLARNLYPEEIGRAPTLARKVKEAVTALKIEANYSKPEIIETYLNTVPFLYNAVGVEMAARTYFGKTARELDMLESATLVGMLKGTSQYNPVQHPRRSLERRNLVLAQMARHGFIPEQTLPHLQAQPLVLSFQPQREEPGPAAHLAQQVRGWLAQWADRHGYDLHADGLRVRTTLHSRLQDVANQAVAEHMARLRPLALQRSRKEPLQAGFLALDPRNGEVRAWVGSTDFALDQFDHVQQSRRQPGSTFKPFVYGAAFARGMQPSDVLLDQPVTIGRGRNRWSPRDATPPTYRPMTLADGLAHSRNSITAQLVDKVGAGRVADLARDLGIRESKLEAVPSLALGSSAVTLKEMVTAYATLANQGRYLPPVVVTQVEDRQGRVLEKFRVARPDEALGEAESLLLVDALRGVIDRGTGRAIRERFGIAADVAGKTGTTQDNTDGWFLLMHPQLVAGAWVGFNDARITMGDGWGPGASSALPIVGSVFAVALEREWIDPQASFGRAEAQEQAAGGGWWSRILGGPAPVPVPEAQARQAPEAPEPPVRLAPRVRVLPQGDEQEWDEESGEEREEGRRERGDHADQWQEKQARAWDREWRKWEKKKHKKGKRHKRKD